MTTASDRPRAAATALVDASSVQVMHSHHFQAALLRALYGSGDIDADALLRVAVDACETGIAAPPPESGDDADWGWLERRFRDAGLGRLATDALRATGTGTARLTASHSAAAWRRRYGAASGPVCGIAAALLGRLLSESSGGARVVVETRCAAEGSAACVFEVTAGGDGLETAKTASPNLAVRPSWSAADAAAAAGADSPALLLGRLRGDDRGEIAGVGGPYCELPGELYAALRRAFETEVPRARGAKFANTPGILLMEAAHRNGFHLFGELLSSSAWSERVAPLCASEIDRVRALLGVPGRLGWGRWEVRSFVPGERLTIRIAESYEAVAHERLFGRSAEPLCTTARGAAAALMNLLYRTTGAVSPALTASQYNALFRSPHSFRATETRCRASGDEFCELVVNPLTG